LQALDRTCKSFAAADAADKGRELVLVMPEHGLWVGALGEVKHQ
jgi:hypothetical protein